MFLVILNLGVSFDTAFMLTVFESISYSQANNLVLEAGYGVLSDVAGRLNVKPSHLW